MSLKCTTTTKKQLPNRVEPGYYNLEVTVTTDDGYEFKSSLKQLECRTIQNGVYIITDKPTYKDSDKGWEGSYFQGTLQTKIIVYFC